MRIRLDLPLVLQSMPHRSQKEPCKKQFSKEFSFSLANSRSQRIPGSWCGSERCSDGGDISLFYFSLSPFVRQFLGLLHTRHGLLVLWMCDLPIFPLKCLLLISQTNPILPMNSTTAVVTIRETARIRELKALAGAQEFYMAHSALYVSSYCPGSQKLKLRHKESNQEGD